MTGQANHSVLHLQESSGQCLNASIFDRCHLSQILEETGEPSVPVWEFNPTAGMVQPTELLLFSVYQSSTLLFCLSFTSLVSYFSLAPCTRLNWQFSVSFQAHIKTSSSHRIISSGPRPAQDQVWTQILMSLSGPSQPVNVHCSQWH